MTDSSKPTAQAWVRAGENLEVDSRLVIDLTLPSGFIVRATRPSVHMFFLFGTTPTGLTDTVAKMVAEKRVDPETLEQTKQEIEEQLMADPSSVTRAIMAMRDLVVKAVVQPRIVVGAALNNPDEIDPGRIPSEDFNFLMKWVGDGCPGVPVITANGGVDLETVRHFPNRGQRRATVRKQRSAVRKSA